MASPFGADKIMSKKALKAGGIGLITLVIAAVSANSSGSPNVGYLAKIGPAPVRMQPARTASEAAVLPPLAMTDPVPAGPTNIVVPPAQNITYRAESPAPAAQPSYQFFMPNPLWWNDNSPAPEPPATEPTAPEPSIPLTNSAPHASAAGDLLPINPRMLVEYFKPLSDTNAASEASSPPVHPSATVPESTFKMP